MTSVFLNTATLVDALCENFMLAINNGRWVPVLNSDGNWITHCNDFVSTVAQRLGYGLLIGKMANDIYDFISTSDDWQKEASPDLAQLHATEGALVIAAQKGFPHGHVCIVRPGNMVMSGKWNTNVPKVVNVGKDVFMDKGVNWAFETPPEYFCLKSMIQI